MKAGEETGLTIVYNTWKFPGKFEKYVTVFSGADGKEKQVITVVGMVEPVPMGVAEVSPRKLAVGALPVGKVTRKELVIKNSGDAVLTVDKVVSKKFGAVYFDAKKAGKPLRIGPGKSVKLSLELKPAKAGRYLDYVLIHGEARNITENGYKVVVLGKAE